MLFRSYLNAIFRFSSENPKCAAITEKMGLSASDYDNEYSSIGVIVPVGYWRKANQIHKWFVDNIQNGQDDCGEYFVSREDLIKLRGLCRKVMRNRKKAYELLPSSSGFFFGGVEYDKYYFEQIKSTIKILDNVINNSKYIGADFYYLASW